MIMEKYYVNDNPQPNGDHEVHKPSCYYFAQIKSKRYLGEYSSCHGAVRKAKEIYPQSNGCYYCCSACHTS